MDKEKYIHFVTFSCFKRRKFLQHPGICKRVLGTLNIELFRNSAECFGFVLMPDHLHLLIGFNEESDLSSFLQNWKSASSKVAKIFIEKMLPNFATRIPESDPFWQRKYYDSLIDDEKKFFEKLNYVHDNPVRAGFVEEQTDWKWSSALWYETGKSVGIKLSRFS